MKNLQRGVVVAAMAVATSILLRRRSEDSVETMVSGWRPLIGPDYR